MTLPGVAGNLVVAALFTWAVFDTVLGLVASSMIVGHAIRWWRAGLVSRWQLTLSVVTASFWALLRPALLFLGGGALAWFFPSFASWAAAAWGPWAGATLGLLGAAYLAQSSLRGENARVVNRAQVYEMFEEEIPKRPTIRQQTFLKLYRQAHDEQKEREHEAAKQEGGGGALAQEADDWPKLAFRIEQSWARQQVTDVPPYFAPGGDWTVLRCRLGKEGAGTFFLAERSQAPDPKMSMAWGEGRVWVTESADADAVLSACRGAFPPEEVELDPGRAVGPAPPLLANTVVLGRGVARQGQGFSGRGAWTASKWFFDEAEEVFLNWSLAERVGEFAEKDELHRAGLLEALAGLARRERAPPATPTASG